MIESWKFICLIFLASFSDASKHQQSHNFSNLFLHDHFSRRSMNKLLQVAHFFLFHASSVFFMAHHKFINSIFPLQSIIMHHQRFLLPFFVINSKQILGVMQSVDVTSTFQM